MAPRDRSPQEKTIDISVPGRDPIRARHVVFDFNGTLAVAGIPIAGVKSRLRRLGKAVSVSIVTADTYGTAGAALRGLPVSVHRIATGRDKERFTKELKGEVIAVGNGNNDVAMFKSAALAIAVLGPEGLTTAALRVASIIVPRIVEAIDLLLQPTGLTATLRS